MPSVTIVNSESDIHLGEGWRPADKFLSNGKIVDKKYLIFNKQERSRSYWEIAFRAGVGSVCVLLTLGGALASKRVRRLFSAKQHIRFATPAFPVITKDPFLKQQIIESMTRLSANIKIKRTQLAVIRQNMDKILLRQDVEGIQYLDSGNENRAFRATEVPGYIFKMHVNDNAEMMQRYQAMLRADQIITVNNLKNLILPQAKLFSVQGHTLIVEQELDVGSKESILSNSQAIEDLAKFINKTGYYGVNLRNNPSFEDKINLFDVQRMGHSLGGLYGSYDGRILGLLDIVEPTHFEIVKKAQGKDADMAIQPEGLFVAATYSQAIRRRGITA